MMKHYQLSKCMYNPRLNNYPREVKRHIGGERMRQNIGYTVYPNNVSARHNTEKGARNVNDATS